MIFQRTVSIFLFSFLLMDAECYAEDPQAGAPVSVVTSQPSSGSVKWSDGWYWGAEGYDKAVEEYKQTNRPMVVYINVGWCPYCRKFEKEILSSPLVLDFLKDKIKVSINPETGSREKGIAIQYGIRGFPSVFLHPPQPGRAVRLSTGVTPEEFIELFGQASQ